MSIDLFSPCALPCGVTLKNRIVKSAMSDSLGDGTGHPTDGQSRLCRRWAQGGLAASIIGEVQCSPRFAEKPGNLVLDERADIERFKDLTKAGRENGAMLWIQLGHAGALAYAPTSDPVGPSALNIEGLTCAEISREALKLVPAEFARTAALAKRAGFGGVQIHAAHGFLLSQFLSPLFNKRDDDYGGSIENRMRLLLESIAAVRDAVGPAFPIAIKLNSSDQLEGGFAEGDALRVVEALDGTSVDLIDISGGTYFPGAKSASDGAGKGPYFLEFVQTARGLTQKPLMLTGGFKTRAQVDDALTKGVDVIGLARALVIEPSLPALWQAGRMPNPTFPRFEQAPEGGITAWYTMRMTGLAEGNDDSTASDLFEVLAEYENRDQARTKVWLAHFGPSAKA
jgi:2,4-dienoyl-CoA reductase-like NADH-dependent reductase (Old Yellow Enzyme family)